MRCNLTRRLRRRARNPACQSPRALFFREVEVLLRVGANLIEVFAVSVKAAVVVTVLTPLELTLEVIVARSAVLVSSGLAAMVDDFLHPPLLSLRCDIYSLIAIAPRMIDARGDVIALRLQHVRQVELERGLVPTHDEHVGIAFGMDT